jgi:uncharacterized membrane protein
MQVLILFTILVFILNLITGGICTIIEGYSPHAGLMAFLAFFVANFVIAWVAAVYITERFLLTAAQRAANEEHTKMLRGGGA